MNSTTDRIERELVLRAPIDRVWRAVANSEEFGTWFGIKFEGPFSAGQLIKGHITPTAVNSEVAANQAPFEGAPLEMVVDRIEPTQLFSFRWHPFAIDPSIDYSSEPMTLVTFTLEARDGGTLLRITESGFDALPPHRRNAFDANGVCWETAAMLVDEYLQGIRIK